MRFLSLVLILAPLAANARSLGISGYSGKQGLICNACHGGGTAPMVALTGPATLMVGASATYTFTIMGGAAMRAGLNVDQNGGATFIAGTGQRVLNAQLTHTAPMTFLNGTATFSFTVTAPATAGTVTLFAAGNSVNFNTTNQGDQAAATQMNITIVDPNAAPDGGAAGGGAGGGGAGGGTATGGGAGGGTGTSTPSSDGGTTVPPVDDDGGSSSSTGGPVVVAPRHGPGGWGGGVIDGGCSAAGGVPLAGLWALGFGLWARRRRR